MDNEHVQVVDQHNQLFVAIEVGLRERLFSVCVEEHFLFNEVNQLHDAFLYLLQKLLFLAKQELAFEEKVKVVKY